MTPWPWIVSVLSLGMAFLWGGPTALLAAVLLSVLEVSLSFDNAVVNATVLRRMDPVWQRRFLTWGILIAVFGMRLIFPVLIVAVAAGVGFIDVARMALTDPDRYAAHLKQAHIGISAFGGLFLLLVFLQFVCDQSKEIHWLGWIERRLAKFGRLQAVEIALALGVLLIVQFGLPDHERLTAMIAGVTGVATFVAAKGLASLAGEPDALGMAARSGAAGFVYLEVLDASFSLDGVIGAFAITTDVVVIMIGLAIGAVFVRSLTVALVRKGTLEEYRYLEHGAHWGIGALAVIMLLGMRVAVPEVVTGLIGVALIGLSLMSSVRYRWRQGKSEPDA
jgi:hypothetical protein